MTEFKDGDWTFLSEMHSESLTSFRVFVHKLVHPFLLINEPIFHNKSVNISG